MICLDVNLKLYFTDVPSTESTASSREDLEEAFSELLDEALIQFDEYIRTDAKILNVKEVEE